MTDEEFKGWVEYDKMEPIHGNTLAMARLSMMAAAFMGSKNIEFDDFYVNKAPKPPKKEQNASQLDNALVGMFSS